MRRLRLIPLATALGAVLLAGALACTPSTPPPAGQSGGDAPPPAQTTEEAPVEEAPVEEAPPAEDGSTTDTPVTETDGATTSSFDAPTFYAMSCAGCHGTKGEGVPQKGPAYATVLHEPDEELMAAILDGVTKDGAVRMPPFRDKLSDEEAKLLLGWLKTEFGGGAPTDAAGDAGQ